jgi:hypothetical protein
MTGKSKKEQHRKRWYAAAHAMQSGVDFEMNQPEGAKATSPKHLRVGINAAMSDHAGLVHLLIKKGIFIEEEYIEAIADQMEEEQKQYERRASEVLGRQVNFL